MNLSYPQKADNCRGFTLIELMVVIVILGILAGLIVPRIMGRPEQAKQLKAKMQIESIGGYLEKGKVPKDPWGNEFIYLSPGIHDDFDIIAYGADGAAGGEDKDADINSWEVE